MIDSFALSAWISIHALRVEGDYANKSHSSRMHGISIHALRVEGDDFCQSTNR